MSEPRRSYAVFLKPDAYKPYSTPEIKGTPYAADAKINSIYPKNEDTTPKANTIRLAFQKQFFQLLDAFDRWGKDNTCDTQGARSGLETIRAQFFDASYTGMQSPLYFESVKQNLEKILLVLRDDRTPLEKRKKAYTSLCPNFVMCGPGLFTHIEAAQNELNSGESREKWLAELRTSLIRHYADRHSRRKGIADGNSIHVFNGFANYACDEKWHPLHTKTYDPLMTVANIEDEDLLDFHQFFENAYHPDAIRECIQVNIHLLLRKCFEEFGFKSDGWNGTESEDYGAFVKKIKIEFAKIGITFSEEEFFECNEDYTQFRLCHVDRMVEILCGSVLDIGARLYFDPVQKKYRDLLPIQWLDDRFKVADFKFDVWNIVPDKIFPNLLFDAITILPIAHIKTLLESLPKRKLGDMLKNNQESYVMGISCITNAQKREFILKTINVLFPPPKEEKAKEVKAVTRHTFFKPGYNKILDELLLHVVHAEQDAAEKIIKAHPTLLFDTGRVKDYSGRTIEGTALQIAFGAEDVEMAEMIQSHLIKLPHGKDEIIKQQKQHFQHDEKPKTYDEMHDLKALDKVTQVICDSDNSEIRLDGKSNFILSERCKMALQEFRDALEPKEVITKGCHFNSELLRYALDNYADYRKFTEVQAAFFWSQVVGYIQRFVPACYAQAICQGLWNLQLGENRERSLQFSQDQQVTYYPLDWQAGRRLGYDFAYSIRDGLPYKDENSARTCFSGYLYSYIHVNYKKIEELLLCDIYAPDQRRGLG